MQPQLLIACDFDGTVTRQDTLVEILNRHGSPNWHDIQEKVVSGEISIREGLQAEMGTVRAGPDQLKKLLIRRIELEPTFPPFLKRMRHLGVPVILLSGGFDFCVETVLQGAGLWPLPFLANRLHPKNNGSWTVEFPYRSPLCADCGHCKGGPIRSWNQQGFTSVFVGNGVTDRCAAQEATLTFAKDELGSWCQREGIQVVDYKTFTDIEQELVRRGWL